VLQDLVGDERAAVTAGEDEAAGPPCLGELGQVDHLGNVGEVVEREADGVGREVA